MPRSQSFHPTPNSLLASSQYQQYSDPHQPHQPLNGYSGRPQSQYNQQRQYNRQSQYRDEYEDDDKPLRPSYYEQGEDRDEGFDVRADFDGKGPRWSEMYGTGRGDPRKSVTFHQAIVGTLSWYSVMQLWKSGRIMPHRLILDRPQLRNQLWAFHPEKN